MEVHRSIRIVVCCAGVGYRGGQWDGKTEEKGKRTTTFIVVRRQDALDGPPNAWVPPRVSPYPIPSSSKNEPPTSLWKGEGRVRVRPRF